MPPAVDADANAHSLIARVGASPWFEARSFHEWRAGSEQHGVLVLASNAAAWTAGDPHAAWTIRVQRQASREVRPFSPRGDGGAGVVVGDIRQPMSRNGAAPMDLASLAGHRGCRRAADPLTSAA